MYCVLNELGQVVMWRFTENEKSESVKPYIKDLSERLGESVQIFVTDNCRRDRAWLKEAFGDHVEVYQDTFHLIQRIGREVNKKLPNGWCTASRLRGLLKGPTTRAELVRHLSAWMREHKSVLTAMVRKAVKAAKRHIWRGCLDILGPGTQNNEGRHRWMRKSLRRGRQGIAAAHALFSIYFHEGNFFLGEKHGQNLLHCTHAHARNAGWTTPPNVPHFGASKLCSKNRGQEHIASNEPAVGKNEEAQVLNPEQMAEAEKRWVAQGIVDAGFVDESASMAAERDDASSAPSIPCNDDWAAPTLDPALPHLTAARRIIVPPTVSVFPTPWRMPCGL